MLHPHEHQCHLSRKEDSRLVYDLRSPRFNPESGHHSWAPNALPPADVATILSDIDFIAYNVSLDFYLLTPYAKEERSDF